MALPFQRQQDPTGMLGFAAGQLSDKVDGAGDKTLLVELTGVLDRGTREWADRTLKTAMVDPDILYLVLDVRDIEWMSDGSFTVIWVALKAMQTRGGALVLIPTPAIREIAELSGCVDFIFLASDPAGAAVILKSVAGEEVEGEDRRRLRFEARLSPVQCLVVRLQGYLDSYAAQWFTTQVSERIEAGFTKLALDLSGYKFIADSGIACFTIPLLKLLKPLDGRLVFFGLDPKIYEVFQLLGFDQFFEIFDTEEEALAALERKLEAPSFPLICKCPICGVRTRVAKPMLGRCRRCGTVLRVVPDGTVFLG